ncbi:hypothetical protein [Ideonella sp.]|jgi:hypothetical protein|uniref:hypothetical protein n=1 Tax=Ideonella sp. TaxID=1929293 RepID=UPI0037BE3A51
MIKFASFLVVLFLFACSSPKAVGFDVRPAPQNSIEVEKLGARKSARLNHRVDAFEVKCDKSLIVVWGEAPPLKKVGSIPFNGVTIISLTDMRPLSSFTLSRGPFEVKFTRDGSAILIDESLFDIKSRKMTDQSADSIEISLLDKCTDFKGKYFGRIDSMTGKLLPNPQ